jgi:hypothetical protein
VQDFLGHADPRTTRRYDRSRGSLDRSPGRRHTLYGVARGVARMVAAGALTPADAHVALYQAGRRAGQTDRDTRAAIAGGFHAESVATEGIAA